MAAVYLYPSTCLFEGTVISEGRGTDKPFRIFGHPKLPKDLISFVPSPNEGAKRVSVSTRPAMAGEVSGSDESVRKKNFMDRSAWNIFWKIPPVSGKDSFFLPNGFFNKLAGNASPDGSNQKGLPGNAIRESWRKDIISFMDIRKKPAVPRFQ